MYKKILLTIIACAALVRIIGLNYGLPLWLIGDEPALIFGALKMLELKTIFPVLHQAEFANTLYYAPYLPYLYLIFFGLATAVKWVFFSGSFEQFKVLLIVDPSIFFTLARYLSVFFGVSSVWLAYVAAKNMFNNERIGLGAAFFIAFAFLPVSLSHWVRHWMPITTLFLVIIAILANNTWSFKKRYVWSLSLVGIGMGVSVQSLFSLVYIGLWALIHDQVGFWKVWKNKWLWQGIGCFVGLSVLAYCLWPASFGFLFSSDPDQIKVVKNLTGLGVSFIFYAKNLLWTEPVLLLFSAIGLVSLFKKKRPIGLIFLAMIVAYVTIFYFFFIIVDRYILFLYPVLALLAAFGLVTILNSTFLATRGRSFFVLGLVILTIVVPIIRFNYLLVKNDTRVQAMNWIKENITEKTILVAPAMRINSTKVILDEQVKIDSKSLRSVDRVLLNLNETEFNRYQVLNTYTISNPVFFDDLLEYAGQHGYKYLLIDPKFLKEKGYKDDIAMLGTVVKEWSGSWHTVLNTGNQSIPDGFGRGLRELFLAKNLGPDLLLIRI